MSEASGSTQEANASAQGEGSHLAGMSSQAHSEPRTGIAGVLPDAPDSNNFLEAAAGPNTIEPKPEEGSKPEEESKPETKPATGEQETILYRPLGCPNVSIPFSVRAPVAPMLSVWTEEEEDEEGIDEGGQQEGCGNEEAEEDVDVGIVPQGPHDSSSLVEVLGGRGEEGEGEGEDPLKTNPIESRCDQPASRHLHLPPLFSTQTSPEMMPPPLPEFHSEASEALDLILGVNPEPPYGVDMAQLFEDATGIPQASQFSPGPTDVGSQLSVTLRGDTVPPLPAKSTTGTAQATTLASDGQVAPEASLVFPASYGLPQALRTGENSENQAADELSQCYPATDPPPQPQTRSRNPWVADTEDDPMISGLSTAGQHSTPWSDGDFSSALRPGSQNPTLYDPENDPYRDPPLSSVMGPLPANSIWRRTFPVNPDTDQLHESGAFSGYDTEVPWPLYTGSPTPPQIEPFATFATYPPSPLPPHEQTLRPWANDISDYGVQFISLRDCELRATVEPDEGPDIFDFWKGWLVDSDDSSVVSAGSPAESDEGEGTSGVSPGLQVESDDSEDIFGFSTDWLAESGESEGSISGISTGLPEGNGLNTPGGCVLDGDVSGHGTRIVSDTPQREAQEADIGSSGSSDQQPATKRQRINQKTQLSSGDSSETSSDDDEDVRERDGRPSKGAKTVPGWVLELMAAEKEQEDILAGEKSEEGSVLPGRSQGVISLTGKAVASAESAESTGYSEATKDRPATPTSTSTPTQLGEEAMVTSPGQSFAVGVGVGPPNFNRDDYKFYPDDMDDDQQPQQPLISRPLIDFAHYMHNPDSMDDEPEPQRRHRGRPHKVRVIEDVTSEAEDLDENKLKNFSENTVQNTVQDALQKNMQTTITDAKPYRGRVVHLGWLVPYQNGKPICLDGCKSLPGTIGCLRCFDLRFPGRRESENLNPLMIVRRLGPDKPPTDGAQGVQEQSSLLVPSEGKETTGHSTRKPSLVASKAPVVGVVVRHALPRPSWETRAIGSTAVLSSPPAKRTASASSDTLSDAQPIPRHVSSTKSTGEKWRTQARDSRGKFVRSSRKAGHASNSPVETKVKVKQTPKGLGTTGFQKSAAQAVSDSTAKGDLPSRTPSFHGAHWSGDDVGPVELEDEEEPESEEDSGEEDESEYED